MEKVKSRPYVSAMAGGVAALLVAKAVRKFMAGRKQIILELDLEHKEFTFRSLQGNKLAMLLNKKLRSVEDIVAALDIAAKDWRVVALICRVAALPNMAFAGDVRAAVQRFREAGKDTIAYAESLSAKAGTAYYLASAFEKFYLSRSGIVNLSGMGVDMPFVKGTLEKCGIRARLLQREEYKNFANFFQEEKFTEAHKEVTTSLLEEIFSVVVEAAAARSGISAQEMEEIFLGGPYTAPEAVKAGLVDGLLYRDEVYRMVSEKHSKAVLLYAEHYVKQHANKRPYAKGKKKVAFIEANGNIHEGPAEQDFFGQRQSIGSDSTCADIRAAIEDSSIQAIVFRVDSGGGSYTASDAINRELKRAQEAGKPVVAWMGAVAGSGGYCVSQSADKIVSQTLTLTGSIGVIMGKFLMQETSNILGLSFDRVQLRDHGEQGTLLSSLHEFSEEQLVKLNSLTDHIYEEFKTDAAKGRRIDKEQMDELAKGRVWSGRQALERKLVDALGDIHVVVDQLKSVCKWAETDTVQLVRFPKKKSILAGLQKPASSLEADKKGICIAGPSFFARFTSSLVAAVCASNPMIHTIISQLCAAGIVGPAGGAAPAASMTASASSTGF